MMGTMMIRVMMIMRTMMMVAMIVGGLRLELSRLNLESGERERTGAK